MTAWVPLNAEKRPMAKWKNAEPCASLAEALSYRPAMVARVIPDGVVVADFDDAGTRLGNQASPLEELSPPNTIWPSTETLRTPRGWHLSYAVDPALHFRKRPVEIQGRKVDVCPSGTLDIVWGLGRHYVRRGVVPLPQMLVEAFLHTAELSEGEGLVSGDHAADGCLFHFPSNCSHDRYARTVIEDWIRRTWRAPEGSRNSILNNAAYMLAMLEPYTTPSDWRRLRQVARVAYAEYADRVDPVIAAARASVDARRLVHFHPSRKTQTQV